MPLQATSGAASYDAFGGGVPAVPNYIEEVFSTYLYTGNGSARSITNGVDLSTYGGLVWIKDRVATPPHLLIDTARGGNKFVSSNTTFAQTTESIISAFNTTGFSLTADTSVGDWNWNGDTYASWTFRKQPKFFDVVTYTGTGSAGLTVSHNLGSVPGCIFVKCTDSSTDWNVYHTSLGNTKRMFLNTTAAAQTTSAGWNNTSPTSTEFTLGASGQVNGAGNTYVAYLFASNAGGFGSTGSENAITCGTFSADAGGLATVNLGYEPQWVLVKRVDAAPLRSWVIIDNMRGWTNSPTSQTLTLQPNTSDAEAYGTIGADNLGTPTATGFDFQGIAEGPYIYIAIRRGPMKVPTSGTSVFGLSARSGTGANATVTGGQTDDVVLIKNRGSAVASLISSRLTGTGYLVTSSTAAEVAAGTTILQANPWDVMDGVKVGTTSTITNASGSTFINYLFRRAPSFFDVVAYTGTGSARTVSHNLAAVPELMIIRNRSVGDNWAVYHSALGNANAILLNLTNAALGGGYWNSTTPTTSVFSLATQAAVNTNTVTYISYLFATLAGVSKVGSYTGTGTTLQIDCGFTAGSRFVMIKRTDSTGDWYIWDSARGIVSGNDPYLLLNSTAAEVTNTDYIDTYSAGFEISSTAPSAINANGGTFIFLAIS